MHSDQQRDPEATHTALFDLTGRTALITGGSRGMGREMAFAFAEAGADVIVASRKLDSCEHTAAHVRQRTGRQATPVACHVGRWNDVTALAATAIDHGVDIVVNNAGMSPLYGKLSDVTEELWDKVLDVNLKGPFRLSVLLGEHMADNGGGSIINVSSIAGDAPTPHEVPYGAAKAGVENLTVSLAKAFGPTVRVNCLIPGAFATDISAAWDIDAVEAQMRRKAPLGRVGRPHEIVGAALYLASDASSYMTGATIRVDGGVNGVR